MGTVTVKCLESWHEGLCSVKLHRSSILSECRHVILDVGSMTIILHASGWWSDVVLGSIEGSSIGWSRSVLA